MNMAMVWNICVTSNKYNMDWICSAVLKSSQKGNSNISNDNKNYNKSNDL